MGKVVFAAAWFSSSSHQEAMMMRFSVVAHVCLLVGCALSTAYDTIDGADDDDDIKEESLPAFGKGTMLALSVGDWGWPSNEQLAVANSMGKIADTYPIRHVLNTGDSFYWNGVTDVNDDQFRTTFNERFTAKGLQVPWYSVLGNHDYKGNVSALVAYTGVDVNHRWFMPARNYSLLLNGGSVLYVFLDTNAVQVDDACADQHEVPEEECSRTMNQDWKSQMVWLSDLLGRTTATWKIVIGHHPNYNAGHHGDSDLLVQTLRPILETHVVQLYLSGHEHDMQHLESNGVTYVVSGGGSQVSTQTPLNSHTQHHGLKWGRLTFGFTLHAIRGQEMQIFFINKDGKVVHKAVVPAIPEMLLTGMTRAENPLNLNLN